jgi:hypothetical protein
MRGLVLTAVVVAAVAVSCSAPKHPGNPSIPSAICKARCDKLHACDPGLDGPSCEDRCRHGFGGRATFLKAEYVSALRACAEQQTCSGDVAQRIASCSTDVRARLEASAQDRTFCSAKVKKDLECSTPRANDFEHCIFAEKVLSDEAVGDLAACLEDSPCRSYRRCYLGVLGNDASDDDWDRAREFREKAVPAANRVVTMTGTIVTVNTTVPVAAAKVCVHDHPDLACATTDLAGAFAIPMPPSQEFALEVTAPDHASTLVGFTPKTAAVKDITIGIRKDATAHARYAAFGAAYPDAVNGFLSLWALGPGAQKAGLDGITMELSPKSGTGPFFFAADSNPDPTRQETSSFGVGVFANVAPGVVEITFGPSSVTCQPGFGAWAATKANTVRAPIAAGFETRVEQRCTK